MARQLLYSVWLEDGVEKSFQASSKDLNEEDMAYLFHHIEKRIAFDKLVIDDENDDLACTVYMSLPSGTSAIARTGYYSLDGSIQKNGYILHAYIADNDESVSPFLYALNTCFKQTLTKEEILSFSSYNLLPNVPFPRPQFVLNQKEIQKFFSKGRQKTLSQLLQALIDGHRSKRITILNEKYTYLKYWFFAIHCCLPEHITKDITFATSVYDKPDDCELVCGALKNKISTINEMAQGNFVFDRIGGPTTENIEAVKYPVFISQLFVENAEAAVEVSKKVHNIMNGYQFSLSTSAGIVKLLDGEFEWFDSAYDIQFFLGKLGFIEKDRLKNVFSRLWEKFKENAFRFLLNEQSLPLLSYVFKNSSSSVKREIIEYLDHHHEQFGIYEAMSFKDYYADVIDKLGFVYEFLPSALLRNNQFDAYRDYLNHSISDMSVLLYIIADNYSALVNEHGEEPLYHICREIFLMLIDNGESELAVDFCRKIESLPDVFVEQVVVRSVWIHAERMSAGYDLVNEELIFSVMEEIITRTKAAAALLMVFARQGRYSENTVAMYMDICRHYPNETAAIDKILSQREVFSAFKSDMTLQKFMSRKSASLDDLSHFFYHFYLKGSDKNHSFESKILELLDSLSPVLQIEAADHLLRLFAKENSNYQSKRIVGELATYVVNQSVNDIYDYYANSNVDIREMTDILLVIDHPISNEFYAAILCVDLKDIVSHEKHQISEKGNSSKIFSELSAPYIVSELPPYNAENRVFLERLYRYLLRVMVLLTRQKGMLMQQYEVILGNFLSRKDFQDALCAYILSFEESKDERLESILTPLVLLEIKGTPVSEQVVDTYQSYLMKGTLEHRRACFKLMLTYTTMEKDRELLKNYLTELFYSDLNFFKKLLVPSPRQLFSNMDV